MVHLFQIFHRLQISSPDWFLDGILGPETWNSTRKSGTDWSPGRDRDAILKIRRKKSFAHRYSTLSKLGLDESRRIQISPKG
jgi:hypothetical protein